MARAVPITTPLNNRYENVIRFFTKEERNEYFTGLNGGIDPRQSGNTPFNFDFGDMINAGITLRFIGSEYEALSKNYLIIYLDNQQSGKDEFYYFITNAKILNKNTVAYTLELDIFTTYLYAEDWNLYCYVEKGHTDRFLPRKPGETFATINFESDSTIYNSDEMEKYSSTIMSVNIARLVGYVLDTTAENVDRSSNFDFPWVYVWQSVDSSNKAFETQIYVDDQTILSQNYVIYAIPLSKKFRYRTTINGDYIEYNPKFIFENLLTDPKTYKMSIGVSPIPDSAWVYNPDEIKIGETIDINFNSIGSENGNIVEIFGKNLVAYYTSISGSDILSFYVIEVNDFECAITFYSNGEYNLNLLDNMNKIDLEKLRNINNGFDYNLEPKLKTRPYSYIELRDTGGDTYNYDIGYVFSNTKLSYPLFVRNFVVSMENPVTYYGLGNSLYTNNTNINTNFIAQNVVSGYKGITLIGDAMREYISQNKNFMITGLLTPTLSTANQVGAQIAQQKYDSAITTSLSLPINMINFFANLDNIKNKPDTIKYMGTDWLSQMNIYNNKLDPRLNLWEIKENEKSIVATYWHMYGYNINKIVNIHNILNTRYWWNYVKTVNSESHLIYSEIPQIIRRKMCSVLDKGVRFFNYHSKTSNLAIANNFYMELTNTEYHLLPTDYDDRR